MSSRITLFACFVLVSIGVACHSMETAPPLTPRPSTWAEPIACAGVDNMHRVSPTLLRGAQPTSRGFEELEGMGVRTVISLRGFHHDELPAGSHLELQRIFFKTWHPEDEDVVRFLHIATDPAQQPVFVHCRWGADRTGMMCAIYRVAVCGWTKDEALAEMTQGDFDFHVEWTNLVEYVRKLDIERVAKEAGLRGE